MNVIFDNGTHKITSEGRLPNDSERARAWRDSELVKTDPLVSATDHPQHAAILAYRQELRDWPDSPGFPNTYPISPI